MNKKSKLKFIKIICKQCKGKNIIFSGSTTRVACPDCGALCTVPKGGKCDLINCTVVEELA